MPVFYEFFAGGGMARAGLGPDWTCLFANDFDAKKGLAYQANWGLGGELRIGDVRDVSPGDLPGEADLAWGSFPCQDLSLAGVGAGLAGERSGSFHAFWDLIRSLKEEGRGPRIVAVENVCGALTSRSGRDFEVICQAYAEGGYRFGALVINADLFVPQSRPRLFVVGVRRDLHLPLELLSPGPVAPFHNAAVRRATESLARDTADALIWLNLPPPPHRLSSFADLVEERPSETLWHDLEDTARLLALMSPVNRAKVEAAKRAGRRMVGCVYRRTRRDGDGAKVQRAEVRFDDVAGCLRTPAGGSSRQILLIVEGHRVRSRLISARETARLMGLGDSFVLPRNYHDAYHLTGDGVVAPVVRHLSEHLFEPILAANERIPKKAPGASERRAKVVR